MSIAGIPSGSFGSVDRARAAISITPTPTDPGSSPSAPVTPAPPRITRDQFRHDLASLFAAVKSGDMTAAEEALKQVQSERPELFTNIASAQASKAPLSVDLKSIVSAVEAGDATAAQAGLTKLQADVHAQSVEPHREHHHHHPGGEDKGGPPVLGGDKPPTPDPTPSTPPVVEPGSGRER
ncbi:MAG: hypothetical protein ABJD11_11765 [Gemmatimonadota bacterium]